MDFDLTQEQQLIQQIARDFGREQLEPHAVETDRKSRYPAAAIKAMAELDFLGLFYPVEYGGAGADFISYILMLEEIARSCASTAAIVATHCSLAAYPIYKWGSEAQKEKYLPAMCTGEKLGGFAFAEPGAAPTSGPNKVVAILDGNNYILNGKKYFVYNGGVADIYIVFALTQKDPAIGLEDLSVFIVDSSTPGLCVSRQIPKIGLCGLPTTEMVFENAHVPKENLLGTENQGYEILIQTQACAGISAAAQAVGISQTALAASIKYAKERVQFGGPIANLQAIQWMLAEMAGNVHMTRITTYQAAYLIMEGKPFTVEAAIARMFTAKAGVDVCSTAVQIHGGYGYGREMILERLLRDVKGTILFESINEYPQKIIAENLLSKSLSSV